MVGLKTIWLTILLSTFVGCLPLSKQTECASGEAFSPSTRACIPLSQQASSFISITNSLPTGALIKYKNDSSTITLSVDITNPYGEPYYLEWERVYAGLTTSLSTLTTSHSFRPSSLVNEVGIHNFVIRVKSSAGQTLDSHNFQVTISENPKPVIISNTISPAFYANSFTPVQLPTSFSFTVSNNSTPSFSQALYRVDWEISRSGLIIFTETDSFPTVSPLGSSSPTGSNFPVYSFDPALLSPPGSDITGNYIIRARLTNNSQEVVAEQQWSVTVGHPSHSKVTSRDLYATTSSPAFNTLTKAYNGVAYSSATAYNFIPCTQSGDSCLPISGVTAQADYCVTLASGHGAYTTDTQYVRVTFFLDGANSIYSALTSPLQNRICLSDAGASVLSNAIFSNTDPQSAQSHTIVARIIDEATGMEYSSNDMYSALGTYPITWNLSVLPQNQKPKVSFGSLTTATCSSTSGNSKTGCSVSSDTSFNVTINLDSDDFYSPVLNPADESKFNYSIRLYRNNVLIHTCSKASPGMDLLTDTDGTNGYTCNLNIKSYDAQGPFDVSTASYQIQAEILDVDSPITPSSTTSSTLTWSFLPGSIIETNSVISISNFSVSGSTDEGQNLSFSAEINDSERDHFSYVLEYCKNASCSASSDFVTLSTANITRTSDVSPYPLSGTYALSEDFLLNSQFTSCQTLTRNSTCSLQFRLRVTDSPVSAAPQSASSSLASSLIKNINPLPALTLSALNPNPLSFITGQAFTGIPLSFEASSSAFIIDSSSVAAEKNYRYQWYVKNNSSVTTYQAIEGASSYHLVWTPSLIKSENLATDNPLRLILCVEDQPSTVISTPNPTDSVCTSSQPWSVTVKNNILQADDISASMYPTELATSNAEAGKETAIWYELPTTTNSITSSAAYVATIVNSKRIYIKKVILRDNGSIDTIDPDLRIIMNPFPSGTLADVLDVKDISITGYQPDSSQPAKELYVAFMASRTGTPGSFYPQVRRIDLTQSGIKTGTSQTTSGKFGFDYNGTSFTNNCMPSTACTVSTSSGVVKITFNSLGTVTGSFNLMTPASFPSGVDFTFGTEICSTCSSAAMANDLSTFINSSTDSRLAGLSSSVTSGEVTLLGSPANDYFDGSTTTVSRISDQLGQIYISGGNWYLPFINSSLGGSDNDKISFYSSPVEQIISVSTPSILEPSTSLGLAQLPSVSKFSNYFDGSILTMGLITKSGSVSQIYRMNPSDLTISVSKQIMASDVGLDIQVAGNSSGVYSIVRVSAANDLKLGAYDINLTTGSEFSISDPAHVDSNSDTEDFFNSSDLASWKLIPYGSEARLLGASKGLGSTYDLYLARLKKQSSNWILSCGSCQKVSSLGKNISPFVKISATAVRQKVAGAGSGLYRLASDGAIASQGIKDVLFTSFGEKGTVPECDPAIGVLNVEVEGITGSQTHTGTAPNLDSGLYRPPLVKN